MSRLFKKDCVIVIIIIITHLFFKNWEGRSKYNVKTTVNSIKIWIRKKIKQMEMTLLLLAILIILLFLPNKQKHFFE